MKLGCCYAFFVLLVLAGIYSWNLFVSVPLKISPETTLYTEPLTSDGRGVDYFAILDANYPVGMKTEKNSAREILRRIGLGSDAHATLSSPPEDAEENYKYYYNALGLEPVSPTEKPETPYLGLEESFERWLKEQFPNAEECDETLMERLARFEEIFDYEDYLAQEPEFCREWVTQNSPALDTITEAVKKGEFCRFPCKKPASDKTPLTTLLMPMIQDARALARGFQLRVYMRVADGDIDGAIDDQITCIELGRQIQKGNSNLVEFLVGLAIENMGHSLEIASNPDAQPTAEQWERMAKYVSLDNAMRNELLGQALKGEQLILLSAVQEMISKHYWEEFLGDYSFLGRFGYDWNHVSRRILEYSAECLVNRNYAVLDEIDYLDNPRKFTGMLLTRSRRSELMAKIIAKFFISAYKQSEHTLRRSFCGENLQKLGIAMQRYRLEHDGLLPPAFSVNAEGKTLHSWRVLILPYIGDEKCKELYAKIRLDEPWDSVYNKEFHDEMPEVFRCPQGDPTSCDTNYAVIVGENQLFDGTGTGRDYVQMMRENSTRKVEKMALIIESSNSIPWMCPDMEPTPEKYTTPITYEMSCNPPHSDFYALSCIGVLSLIPENYDGRCLEEILPFITGTVAIPVSEGGDAVPKESN